MKIQNKSKNSFLCFIQCRLALTVEPPYIQIITSKATWACIINFDERCNMCQHGKIE